ncbi:MAG: Rpn family recombination-promoting nuclease/putative transposase [Lachnospiraceae bacterium]|nr:Rpn family recombination-promoting nuclease/putative transposase [Lachnospiraceae bacterium]
MKDSVEKNLISCNDVFADICNGLLFEGKQVVREDALQDTKQRSQYKADTGKLHEEERDVSKIWNALGMNLVLMGMENQSRPDKDMPFRVIAYDGAAYRSQLLSGKKERYPVVTMILYFGMKPWNYTNSLVESFRPKLQDCGRLFCSCKKKCRLSSE